MLSFQLNGFGYRICIISGEEGGLVDVCCEGNNRHTRPIVLIENSSPESISHCCAMQSAKRRELDTFQNDANTFGRLIINGVCRVTRNFPAVFPSKSTQNRQHLIELQSLVSQTPQQFHGKSQFLCNNRDFIIIEMHRKRAHLPLVMWVCVRSPFAGKSLVDRLFVRSSVDPSVRVWSCVLQLVRLCHRQSQFMWLCAFFRQRAGHNRVLCARSLCIRIIIGHLEIARNGIFGLEIRIFDDPTNG